MSSPHGKELRAIKFNKIYAKQLRLSDLGLAGQDPLASLILLTIVLLVIAGLLQ